MPTFYEYERECNLIDEEYIHREKHMKKQNKPIAKWNPPKWKSVKIPKSIKEDFQKSFKEIVDGRKKIPQRYKTKIDLAQPKSIKEAVDDLEVFLECDLYTKFRPNIKINKQIMYRKDFLKDEDDFLKYLRGHFNILEKEIIKLIGKKRYEKTNK